MSILLKRAPIRRSAPLLCHRRWRQRGRWALHDLPALRHEDTLFVYKHSDLHISDVRVSSAAASALPRVFSTTGHSQTFSPFQSSALAVAQDFYAKDTVTVHAMLSERFPDLVDAETKFGFRVPHNLDYATSGVLCVALSKDRAREIAQHFEHRRVDKLYLALVDGHVEQPRASISAPIVKDESDPRGFRMAVASGASGASPSSSVSPREARTELFRVGCGYYAGRPVSKVLLQPQGGRRHQLRVHLAAFGHPVVGDVTYEKDREAASAAQRMMLHAYRLRLPSSTGGDGGGAVHISSCDPFPAAAATGLQSVDTGTGVGGVPPIEFIERDDALHLLSDGATSDAGSDRYDEEVVAAAADELVCAAGGHVSDLIYHVRVPGYLRPPNNADRGKRRTGAFRSSALRGRSKWSTEVSCRRPVCEDLK